MGHMLINDLREARLGKGLSRKALADRLGCSEQALKRLEAGTGTMPLLLDAMQALDFRLSGLARGDRLHEQLRHRRMNLLLPIAEAARLAGLSRATVAGIERGRGSVRSVTKLLTALAPGARRRAPDRAHWDRDHTGKSDDRFTPPEFLAVIYEAFGEVDLDPCAHAASPVVAKRKINISDGGDGLEEPWQGRLVYLNPPFSALLKWLRRANQQWLDGHAETIVALVPARMDSAWFHDHLRHQADIYVLRGRLRFLTEQGRGNQAPFPLMVVMWGANSAQKNQFTELIDGFWLT
jgi:transcriptional regulator with XRE-family HTH domain